MKYLKKLIIIFSILLPSVVRIVNYNLVRIHGDDMLTAYFSAHYNLLKTNFLAPVPPNLVDWVCQFPSPFFFLQKLFFIFFGESLLSVKLSVIPYVLIVSLMLFLIVKEIFNNKVGVLALVLYAFFAPSIYLETLGLHFISSTAIFMIFFYFLLLHLKSRKLKNLILAGIFCGLCYLFYSSSYIALPILFLFFFWELITKNNRLLTIRNYFVGFILSLLILFPFFFIMIRYHNFYIANRAAQVSLLGGEWSTPGKTVKSTSTAIQIVFSNFKISFQSIYKNNIGGHGGYNFGHFAFFDKFNMVLFILGLILSCFLMIRRKKQEIFFIIIVVSISFIIGVVLTIPPPAFHRFSLAFPFLIILMVTPFYFIFKMSKKCWIIFSITVLILCFYIAINFNYFKQQEKSELVSENIKLSKIIIEKFPKRNIYIASFPGFVFEKTFYFVETSPRRKIKTDYHINLLNSFNNHEKYIYIIIFPEVFNSKFQEKDPIGKIIYFSSQYSLFVN
jgi:4-amino-4-deoxy-L-arabinose transferase-like glycosyltransferase